VPPTETETGGGTLTFALFMDVEDNKIGLIKQAEGDAPEITKGGNPPVDWFEVVGRSAAELRRFYVETFGWKMRDSSGEGFEYFEIEAGPRGIAGGIGSTPDGQPAVRVYARVDDLKSYLYRAEGLGAKTVVDPLPVTQGTTIAIFSDPQGNDFGVYEVSG
jgi:predicted enzyme related to lactoylglutathione lyase